MSRDGTRVAYSKRAEGSGTATSDIWVLDTATGRSTRATFDPANEFAAAWSPDNRQLAFNSNRNGTVMDIFVKPSDNSGAETELWRSGGSKFPADWTADGRHLLVVEGSPGRGGGTGAAPAPSQRLWALPLAGDRKPFPASPGTGNESPGSFSPDPAGRWLTYSSNERLRNEVYVAPFPPTGPKWQISTAGGVLPRWNHDGTEIYFIEAGSPTTRMMAARVDARGAAVKVLDITPLFPVTIAGSRGVYGVMPGGQKFLISTPSADQTATLPPPTVVINWPAWRGK